MPRKRKAPAPAKPKYHIPRGYLHGEALEVAFKLGLKLKVGDRIVMKSGSVDLASDIPYYGQVGRITEVDNEVMLSRGVGPEKSVGWAQFRPASNDDDGRCYIFSDNILAYKPKKRSTHAALSRAVPEQE